MRLRRQAVQHYKADTAERMPCLWLACSATAIPYALQLARCASCRAKTERARTAAINAHHAQRTAPPIQLPSTVMPKTRSFRSCVEGVNCQTALGLWRSSVGWFNYRWRQTGLALFILVHEMQARPNSFLSPHFCFIARTDRSNRRSRDTSWTSPSE